MIFGNDDGRNVRCLHEYVGDDAVAKPINKKQRITKVKVEQFVMAYGVEQDRLRALLPDGFSSLRPVLRINVEIRDDKCGYVELNTAIEKDGNKGWLNVANWTNVPFERIDKTTKFKTDFLEISFTLVGIEGSCPAEKDNAGCYFIGNEEILRKPEIITENKEFCDCFFAWKFSGDDAFGKSEGKTLPAHSTEIKKVYPKERFVVENFTKIPCVRVLGTYTVRFERN